MYKKVLIGFGVFVIFVLWLIVAIGPDWLWFANLEYSSVFWTMLLSKFGFGAAVWLVFILILFFNIYAANRLSQGSGPKIAFTADGGYFAKLGLSGKSSSILFIAFILLISLVIASKGSYQWDMFLRYLFQQPFGNTDPIFSKDIGFYVFSLPFYLFIQNGLLILFILVGLLTMGWYLKEGALQVIGDFTPAEDRPISVPKITISLKAKKHLIFLAGIVVLLLAWGYHLKIYKLLYSTQGPAFGASYTDVHLKFWAFWVLILFSLGLAAVFFYNAVKPKAKVILIGAGIWLGAVVIFNSLLPTLVQKVVVKPNELAKESPYIAYNIDHTRRAYNLDKIEVVHFPVSETLRAEDIETNDLTIKNIRIWDERPLLQTYRQIQSIRLYYDFDNVDIDRYLINNQLRQVTLSARELVVDRLPPQANTWVNRHLIYTHGYGLALSPVNEVSREGLPNLFVKDVPPSFIPDLELERPEIYYGEKTDEYVLVKTNTEEFDYPKGDKNVYTTYQGAGGVHIKSFGRRLLFALGFLDSQIMFTTYLNPESRIMYNRRIDKRVSSIAPFLDYDDDPYLVVSGGKLYWIQDAYTTSNMYPYSRRSYKHLKNKKINYIRNSVKVTIDAYNGDVCFYIVDETDPLIKTYSSIFPDLFKPVDEMPADLKKHMRYPRDLFALQVETYTNYHMEDVQVFYNQEDFWQIPDEIYSETRQAVKPYYVIMRLPEEKKEEFLLMLPFTPSKKDNMIGWLSARCDPPNYGKLLVYKLPKEKLIYGPMQIEARVDQQTEISRELSLWSQKGSRVIRGNLLAIPIADSFIYVEPIYLESRQEEKETPSTTAPTSSPFRKSQRGGSGVSPAMDKSRAASLPELKRVIVAFSNSLVMAESIDKAINSLLGQYISPEKVVSPRVQATPGTDKLGELALQHYNKAKDYLRQGNWAEYGKELENLENVLRDMISGHKEEKQ